MVVVCSAEYTIRTMMTFDCLCYSAELAKHRYTKIFIGPLAFFSPWGSHMPIYQWPFVIQVSQRGDSPFVYRDGIGWPASLPYIRKIRVSVAIGTQSGIRLHKRVPMVKIWGSSKNYQNWITGKLLKL